MTLSERLDVLAGELANLVDVAIDQETKHPYQEQYWDAMSTIAYYEQLLLDIGIDYELQYSAVERAEIRDHLKLMVTAVAGVGRW